MTIDIKGLTNSSINKQGSSNQTGTVNNETRSSNRSTSSSVGSDRVSITTSATQLSALEDRINSLSVVDTNRVTETRHALATGTHQVNHDNTADGLLASEYAFAQQK